MSRTSSLGHGAQGAACLFRALDKRSAVGTGTQHLDVVPALDAAKAVLYPVHAAEQPPAAVLEFLVGNGAGAQVGKFLQNCLLCAGGISVLHTAVHRHAASKALEGGGAVVAQMVPLPHIEEQAAGHTAAVQRHGKAHRCQLLRLHGLPQCEQHTQLCLHHIVVFGLMHRRNGRHGHVFHQRQRGAVDADKLCQQSIPDGGGLGGVAAQHQQLDVCSTQHLLISGGQHGGGKAVHLFQITLLPHARRAVAKKLPGWPDAGSRCVYR